jgi:uncharacterized pyridoxamine 5'-phosphate oxidase family protein
LFSQIPLKTTHKLNDPKVYVVEQAQYPEKEYIMDKLNYKIEIQKIFDQLSKNKIISLATCVQNYPTVRTLSFIIHNKKIYFQTGIDLIKYQQICENKNSALCSENIQIEGIANIIGKPMDNNSIMEIYKKHHPNSFETYSHYDKEILVEVVIQKITKWDYDNDRKPYRIFLDLEKETVYKEMYF